MIRPTRWEDCKMPATASKPTPIPTRSTPRSRTIRLHRLAEQQTPPRQIASRPRSKSAFAQFFSSPFGIEKTFTVLSFLLSTSLLVFCCLDLTIAWPWRQASRLFDWGFLVCGLVLLGMTFDVFRDQTRVMRQRRRDYSNYEPAGTIPTDREYHEHNNRSA